MALGNKTNSIRWTDLIVPNGGINENQSPQMIPEKDWTAGTNVEPLIDGVRARQGMTGSQDGEGWYIYADSDDISNTHNHHFLSGTQDYAAQAFDTENYVADATPSIDYVKLRLLKTGSPVGRVEVALYSDDGSGPAPAQGIPSSAIAGANFHNWSTVNVDDITTSYAYYTFELETAVTLSADTIYWLVVRNLNSGTVYGTDVVSMQVSSFSTGNFNGYIVPSPVYLGSGDGSTWSGDIDYGAGATDITGNIVGRIGASSDAVGVQSITQNSTTGTDDRTFTTSAKFIGQTFTVASDCWCGSFAVRLKHATGSGTGSLHAGLFEHSNPQSTGDSNMRVEANFLFIPSMVTMDRADVGTSYAWYKFDHEERHFLSTSKYYAIIVWDEDFDNNMSIEEDTTGNPYAGTYNWVEYSSAGTLHTFTRVTAADLNFRIFSGAMIFQAISDYRLSDGTTAYHMCVIDGITYYRSGDIFIPVSGSAAEDMTAGQNVFPSWTVGQDRWFVTDNTVKSKKFYDLSGTEYWENEGIGPPTDTLTLTSPAQANPLTDTGDWYIDYIYWNSDIGQPSNAWNDFVADATNKVTVSAGDVINVAGLPSAVDRAGDRATGVRVYARAASSAIFRLALDKTFAQVTAASGAFDIDANTSITTEAEPDHDVPPVHEIKEVAANRQFIANVVDPADSVRKSYRLMFSAIYGGTPYYESFPPLNYRDIGKGDGDYIRALAYVPPRTLLIGMKNSIIAIDARNPKVSDQVILSKKIGVAGHNAIIVHGQRAFFLSDSARNLGMYVWEPGMGEPQLLSGIDDTLKGLEKSRFKYASCAVLAPGDNRFQWWILLSENAATKHNVIMVYDWNLQAWTKYTKQTGREINILGNIDVSGIDQIYGGGYNGVEYLMDQGSQDAGKSYDSTVTLKYFDFGASYMRKRLRWIDYVADATGGEGIRMLIERNYGAKTSLIGTNLTTTQPDGMVWGTGVWGTDKWAAKNDEKSRTSIRGLGEVFKPTFYSDSAFHIKTLQFAIQETGRK